MMEIALGELGLNPEEFYEYSMDEFVIKIDGTRKAKMEEWERTRVLAYVMAKPYMKNKNMSIEQFWPMNGDPVQKGKSGAKRLSQMNKEEQRAYIESIKQTMIRHGLTNSN
jgi:hypothetical protein